MTIIQSIDERDKAALAALSSAILPFRHLNDAAPMPLSLLLTFISVASRPVSSLTNALLGSPYTSGLLGGIATRDDPFGSLAPPSNALSSGLLGSLLKDK
jgi:hypothetical protein